MALILRCPKLAWSLGPTLQPWVVKIKIRSVLVGLPKAADQSMGRIRVEPAVVIDGFRKLLLGLGVVAASPVQRDLIPLPQLHPEFSGGVNRSALHVSDDAHSYCCRLPAAFSR